MVRPLAGPRPCPANAEDARCVRGPATRSLIANAGKIIISRRASKITALPRAGERVSGDGEPERGTPPDTTSCLTRRRRHFGEGMEESPRGRPADDWAIQSVSSLDVSGRGRVFARAEAFRSPRASNARLAERLGSRTPAARGPGIPRNARAARSIRRRRTNRPRTESWTLLYAVNLEYGFLRFAPPPTWRLFTPEWP